VHLHTLDVEEPKGRLGDASPHSWSVAVNRIFEWARAIGGVYAPTLESRRLMVRKSDRIREFFVLVRGEELLSW